MIDYKLIPMTHEDYEFIYEVKKNAYKKYVELNWGIWNEDIQRDFYKKFIETYKNNIYTINFEDKKIGFYQGETLESGDYEIGNICIIPEYQGKGIGTLVLKDVLEKHNNQNIHIQYFKQNPVGILYARLGFVHKDETNYHYQMIKYAVNKKKIKL